MQAWRLCCTHGPLSGRQWSLPEHEPLLIGRGPNNHIAIPDAALSRQHVRLYLKEDVAHVEDLGSRNGTLLNGRRIEAPRSLRQGDTLVVGEHAFVVLTRETAAGPADLPETDPRFILRNYIHLPSRTIQEGSGEDAESPRLRKLGLAKLQEDPFSRSFLQVGKRRIQWKRALFYGITFTSIAAGLWLLGQWFLQPALLLRSRSLTLGLGMALFSLSWLPLLYLVNRTGKNSSFLLILLLLWGSTIAISLSLLAARLLPALSPAGWPSSLLLFSFTAGPLVEEAVKTLALLLVMACLYDEFTNSIDGMILGMAVGLGFAFGENMLYFTSAALSDRPFLVSLFLLRSPLLPTICHPAWSAMVGYSLGIYREKKQARWRWRYPAGGFLLAAACHTSWNMLSYYYQTTYRNMWATFGLLVLTIGILVILITFVLIWLALQKERSILIRYLSPLLDSRILSSNEFIDLLRPLRFYRELARSLPRGGWRPFQLRLRLYRDQLQLAYRKWHLDTGDRYKGIHFDRVEMEILERIVQTKRLLPGDASVSN
jgi:RsiW-degrading membrane proteinase PrsW (M82 family)